jgi:hypothetical protein
MMCRTSSSSSTWRTKCARVVEGHAWHSPPASEAGKADKPSMDVIAQCSGKKKKKKARGIEKPLVGAPTTTVVVAGGGRSPCGDKCPRQVSDSDNGATRCSVHNSKCHYAEECWEIKKLMEQFREQMRQQSSCQDGASFRQWEGKQKVNPEVEKEEEMEYQDAKRVQKAVYSHSDSSGNERHKTLHVIFRGS